MFPFKTLLTHFSKLSKCKLEIRPNALFFFLGAKAGFHLNSPGMLFFSPGRTNGFSKTFSVTRQLPEIINNGRNASMFSNAKCWNCKRSLEVKDFACTACGALQYPKPDVNYFQLLGVSQSYEVELEDLSSKFRNLQMIFHPDKFANKSKEELQISESYSRLLNKAYSTLKDPISRGFYLLELQNLSVDSHPLQQEFLLKMMEQNEELDGINSQPILSKFMEKNNQEIAKQFQLVKEAFHSNQMDSARVNLLKLNYLVNLDTKIKEKQCKVKQSTDS